MTTAAVAAAGLIGLVIVFQVALVIGAPWGAAAWGGGHPGRLPTRLRVASAGAIVVLVWLAWIVLAAAGTVSASPIPRPWLGSAAWVGTAYFGLGTIVNAVSRSKVERLWAPVSLITAVCYGLVAAA
jgi:hypothetical protein